MGILDEAIREHLELKRQHGAAEGDLRKLEDEAFGPPERPGAPPGDAVADAAVAVEDEPAPAIEEAPAEHEEPLPEPDEAGEPAAAETEVVRAETEEHPPPEPPEEPEAIADEPTEIFDLGGEAAVDEPEAAEEPRVEEPAVEEPAIDDDFFSEQSLSDELDQALDAPETAEARPAHDVPESPPQEEESSPQEEEAPPDQTEAESAEGDEESEDVLEETPEFLQDTPEHDQMWFEQRPPKDFDFDD